MHHYLRHMANFARIVEAGSMRAAADLLGQSPSGLSDSVRILETHLGTALLVRHAGGITPTSEGERIYHLASGVVDLLDQAMGLDRNAPISGPCRISVPTEIATSCIGDAISLLSANYPSLEVRVFAEDELVDFGRLARDYFIRISPKAETFPGLRPVWTTEVAAILVAGSQLLDERQANDLAKVQELPAIFGTDRRPPYDFPLTGTETKLVFEEAVFASLPSVRLELAKQGMGVAGVLDICAAKALNSGKLRRVLPDLFEVPLTLQLLTPHKRMRAMDIPVEHAVKKMLGQPLEDQ